MAISWVIFSIILFVGIKTVSVLCQVSECDTNWTSVPGQRELPGGAPDISVCGHHGQPDVRDTGVHLGEGQCRPVERRDDADVPADGDGGVE